MWSHAVVLSTALRDPTRPRLTPPGLVFLVFLEGKWVLFQCFCWGRKGKALRAVTGVTAWENRASALQIVECSRRKIGVTLFRPSHRIGWVVLPESVSLSTWCSFSMSQLHSKEIILKLCTIQMANCGFQILKCSTIPVFCYLHDTILFQLFPPRLV